MAKYIDVEKLKAEIERLKDENNNIRCDSNRAYCQGYGDAFVDLLPFLSDLEKSEKPINQYEDFRGEMREWVELMVAASFPEQDNDFISEEDYRSVIKQTARHFALWQKEKMMKEGLDAVKSGQFNKIEKTIAGVFVKYGMDRQRETMLKETVEANVGRNFTGVQQISFTVYPDKYKDGEKVKLIVVKED